MSSSLYDDLSLSALRERQSEKWRAFPPDVLPVWVAEMDYPLAPPIREVLHSFVDRGDTGYPWVGELPSAFASFALARYGVAVDPSRAYVVSDIMRGIQVALEVLTPPDSGVAFLTPAYPPFFESVPYVGRRVVSVPLVFAASGRPSVDLDRLASALARPDVSAFLLCNPHNPTGRMFTAGELSAMAEIAERSDVVVLSDEVHAPLTYGAARHVPFWSLSSDVARRSVTFVSASKAWNVPGLKCAMALAGSPEVSKALQTLPAEILVGSSVLGIAANIAAFRSGLPWLTETLDYLAVNRTLLQSLLAEKLPSVRYALPDATYLAWLDCRDLGLGPDPAAAFLERGRVAAVGGHHFGVEEGTGFVRFNFATSKAILTEAVARMASAVES
ncbi:MalY/PatB family protein [Tenggerimyces flavus]|uniref:cysteine-S-conjugate beta-lyase n=1 Tax=Tenggerimyces flavus TaxID=1708749 RepID=A0ABV7Y9F4_9ACTN|nr:aminotransferase class I/II-fold pyridoxal phosphate-dependent enzyme [Tenggerimyces flavus]MBM7791236.1 cystathionine beta-lyase [Tenggerimyces flavus]